MGKELLLVRHGEFKSEQDKDDFKLPLKTRGKRGAQKLGLWLAKQDLIPDYIMCSPATRTLTTAEKACKVMGVSIKNINYVDKLYQATQQQLVDVIRSCPANSNRLMIVGHDPAIAQLVLLLANQILDVPMDGKIVQTTKLVEIEIQSPWHEFSPAKARLLDIIPAKDLAKKFPFPDLDSNEFRDRPAYYYYQSAVIPYRILNNNIEVLVIRSSGNKRWVFPKGIIDIGLSPQASAAKEALEEAGVKGKVEHQQLGEYYASKWGAECHVQVYPMFVSQIVPDHSWRESHRNRLWIDINDASKYIESLPMLEMLGKLQNDIGKVENA